MLWYEGVNCLWQDVQRLLDNSETAWLSVIFGASHSPCLPKEGPISSNIESEFHLNIVYSERINVCVDSTGVGPIKTLQIRTASIRQRLPSDGELFLSFHHGYAGLLA